MEDSGQGRTLKEDWEAWTRAGSSFFSSVVSLASVRLAMARAEARQWSRAAMIRIALLAGALLLVPFAFALLTAGLVAAFHAWTGSLVGSIFIVFGIYVISAAGLVFAATRGKASRPIFEATLREIRQDLEHLKGEEP
jgi:uncharacterized membrane protein YqjE